MAKMHSLLQGSDFYYSFALELIAKDDLSGAVKNLLKAINISPKEKYFLELAECYHRAGSPSASNAIYFKLMSQFPSMDYLMAIARNYLALGYGDDSAEFTFKTLMNSSGKISERRIQRLERVLESEEVQTLFSFEKNVTMQVINVQEKKENNFLNAALYALNDNDPEKAVMLASQIKEKSKYYESALECLSLAAYTAGDKELAVSSAEKLIKLYPYNLSAIRVLINYEKYLEIADGELESALEKIVAFYRKNKKGAELLELAYFFFERENYHYALQVLLAAKNVLPLSERIFLPLAQAFFFSGDKIEALKVVKQYKSLYPFSHKAKLLNWLFERSVTANELKTLLLFFPASRIEELKNEFYTAFSYGSINKLPLTQDEEDVLDMLLSTNDENVLSVIFELAASSREGIREYFNKKFMDNNLTSETRQDVLRALVEMGDEGEKKLLLDDRIAFFTVRKLKLTKDYSKSDRKLLTEVYADVTAAIVYLGYSYKSKPLQTIVNSFNKIDDKFKNPKLITALVHYYYNFLTEVDMDLEALAEIYSSKPAFIKKYLENYDFFK